MLDEPTADNPKGPVAVLTGSTNNPAQDGTARGFWTGLLVFIVGVTEVRVDLLSETETITLLALVGGAVFQLMGFWDKYVKPRLSQR